MNKITEPSAPLIPLATEFNIGRYPMKQLKRSGMVAIFSQGKFHFEVVIIQTRPHEFKFGKHYPPHEVYPRSELWGSAA